MMGRLNRDQGQLFYSFSLDDAVPDDHQVREIATDRRQMVTSDAAVRSDWTMKPVGQSVVVKISGDASTTAV
jgi:hypothetical protein